jgi:hypothetical protein
LKHEIFPNPKFVPNSNLFQFKFISVFIQNIFTHPKFVLTEKGRKPTCWAELGRPIRRPLPGESESLPQRAWHSSLLLAHGGTIGDLTVKIYREDDPTAQNI